MLRLRTFVISLRTFVIPSEAMRRFIDKKAMVTGGSSGPDQAIARLPKRIDAIGGPTR